VIGEEPPKTSDPELAAKRAIDEAVATLRSLAEGVQSRPPARPQAETRMEGFSSDERAASEEAFMAWPPVEARLREGFHRLGLVLALACAAAAGVVLLASSDFSGGQVDIRRALPLLLAAGAVYLLCQSMAWVALGFIGEPEQRDDTAASGETTSHLRPHLKGIGGWLWFPVLATAFTPIAILERLYSLAASFHEVMNRPLEARAFLLLLAVIGIGFLIAWLYALVLMVRRHRRFPRLYVVLSLWSLALFTIGSLIATLYFDAFGWADFLKGGAEELARVIWIPYMLRSRRVRSTFVN
jgi:hypothetical protein